MYPKAQRGSPRAATYGPLPKWDLPLALAYHTTETGNWAGFRFGLTAPHYSYKPMTREWRWHGAALDRYVGTMRSSRVTRTPANEKTVQVEIIAYSDASKVYQKPNRIWVGDFQEVHYRDLAEFAVWVASETPLRVDHVTPTPNGGWRYGSKSPYRLDQQVWLNFDGISAHGAVPGQSHWDTGVLDLSRISAYAQDIAPPPLPPIVPPGEDEMTREDQMTTPEWVNNLSAESITRMFDSGMHGGTAQHWIALKANPTDPSWNHFRDTTVVRRPYFF